MHNVIVHSNRADGGNGRAIYIYNGNEDGQSSNFQLNVDNTSALKNRADWGNGGGLYIGSSGNINSRTSMTQC